MLGRSASFDVSWQGRAAAFELPARRMGGILSENQETSGGISWQIVRRRDAPTGVLPGRVVRGAQAAPVAIEG